MSDTPDYKMFLKLMSLTTSSFDGEALNAIRMANAVLARTNQNVGGPPKGKDRNDRAPARTPLKLLDQTSTSATTTQTKSTPTSKPYTTVARASETFKAWINSVHEWWEQKGYLTNAQYNTLKRAAQRR